MHVIRTSRVPLVVKNPPAYAGAITEAVREDPVKEEMATHSSIPAWRIPWTGGAWRATVHRVAQSRTQLKRLSSSSKLSLKITRLKIKLHGQAHPLMVLGAELM